jgi:hypothetical protein
MSEITTNEQAMQWCRERDISVNFAEGSGRVQLYFQGCLLMEEDTIQEAITRTVRYSRAPLPKVEQE